VDGKCIKANLYWESITLTMTAIILFFIVTNFGLKWVIDMNEIIQELAERAFAPINDMASEGIADRSTFNMHWFQLYNQKFAELIVQECVNCSLWVGKVNKNAIEPIHTAHAINKRIKKRLGFEERMNERERLEELTRATLDAKAASERFCKKHPVEDQ
jgi:hypothetical protein